ncbi:beta-galactosidase domain 4-containing protein [Streptomyces sp. NPDC047079]|uniref:beta-galactosidase domain 4-containing protein n=1 Tax=Streptomyces sp. NPDC047079 TaxID=3154607 RepID=UPI0033FB1390
MHLSRHDHLDARLLQAGPGRRGSTGAFVTTTSGSPGRRPAPCHAANTTQPSTWEKFLAAGEQPKRRPLIRCEYGHAMGDGNGMPADHWAAIETTPGLQDGFTSELWCHGIVQRVSDGRPAGRGGAGLYDNGVAAPGHRWAYGDDVGDDPNDGTFRANGLVFPDRTPEPAMCGHPEIAAPVRMKCFRHEGIVLRNNQRFRGLDWLTAEWQLSRADGPTLTAPAELPRLAPGECAAVPLPFALPLEGGETWLTLRVRTAHDEPWAPRGTEVCVPRVRLRGPAPEAAVPLPGGTVEVDGEGLLIHPLLTAPGHHDRPAAPRGCVVHIDGAHRGLSTASCGPDTSASLPLPPDVHRWSWTGAPSDPPTFTDLSE